MIYTSSHQKQAEGREPWQLHATASPAGERNLPELGRKPSKRGRNESAWSPAAGIRKEFANKFRL